MPNLNPAIRQLKQERARITSRLHSLNAALAALSTRSSRRGGISAAGRAKIAAAQRARWARVKGQKVVSIASKRKRKLSQTALSRIRAAQKARWAKWRKQHKTA